MLLLTRVIRIGIWFMVRPRLEVVHIGSMLNRGRGKWVPDLTILSYMI